jgi:cytochrome c
MVLGAVVAAFIMLNFLSSNKNSNSDEIAVAGLSAHATKGKPIYEANCSLCHGQNGSGTDKGPPFIHKIYEPSHHGDASFQQAARSGVRAHHWPFGNMPPVPNVTKKDVKLIVAYVRELQRANGIR